MYLISRNNATFRLEIYTLLNMVPVGGGGSIFRHVSAQLSPYAFVSPGSFKMECAPSFFHWLSALAFIRGSDTLILNAHMQIYVCDARTAAPRGCAVQFCFRFTFSRRCATLISMHNFHNHALLCLLSFVRLIVFWRTLRSAPKHL
jgi:hypothetical protein